MPAPRKNVGWLGGQSSIFSLMEQNRKTMDALGQGSIFSIMESNRTILDAARGQRLLSSIRANDRNLAELVGGQGSVFSMMERHRKTMDSVTGQGSVFAVMKRNQKLMDSVLGRTSFATMIGAQKSVSEMFAQPNFAAMVGAPVMPQPAWLGVLDGIRDRVGPNFFEGAVEEFEIAADLAGDAVDDTWWVARLPVAMQAALLFVALDALDKIGAFVVDLSGADIPPAYLSGAEALICLAACLLAILDARALSEDEQI